MADLNALKSQFMALQKSSSSFKLSERTVVEIINKIANRGKIHLLHTVTGKEYVVDEKVNFEILNEIKKQKKVSIVELSKTLELPLNTIEKKVKEIMEKNKNFTYVEGKIMTNDFLNKITMDIKTILSHDSSASIADLANRFELPIDYMKKFLKEKIDSHALENAKLYPTRVITDYYIEIQTKRIRPALISSISPINIATLLSLYGIDEMLVNDIIDSIIAKGELKGRFTSNIYESQIYSGSQVDYLKGELMTNNYLDYSKLKNIGIAQNGQEYLKDLAKRENFLQDGVFLKEYFISNSLKNTFEFALADNLGKGAPTNLNTVFFFRVDEEDAQSLLESIGVGNDKFIYTYENLVPIEIINQFVKESKEELKDIASKEYNSFLAKMKEEEKKQKETEDKKDKEEDTGKKKKGKKKKKEKAHNNNDNANKDEFVPELNKGNKEVFKNKFKSNQLLDELNEKDDSIDYLFDNFIINKLQEIYTQNIKDFIKIKSNAQSASDPKTLMSKINSDFLYLKLVQKNFKKLSDLSRNENYKHAIQAITANLCKKELSNLIKDLITYQIIHMKLKLNISKLNTYNERRDVIEAFPDDEIREVFGDLNDYIQNRKFGQFMDKLNDKKSILAVDLNIFDKKEEKNQIDKYTNDVYMNIDKQLKIIGMIQFKDYLSYISDLCSYAMGKKGYYLKMPSEVWVIGIFVSLFSETAFDYANLKEKLEEINTILNKKEKGKEIKPEDVYAEEREKLDEIAKGLLQLIK